MVARSSAVLPPPRVDRCVCGGALTGGFCRLEHGPEGRRLGLAQVRRSV